VGVGESLTNWLLWAFGIVLQTGYCVLGGEFDKLFIVGVGKSLKTGYCGRGVEFDKLVIVSVGES
jgi:hypothetical protein